MAEVLTSTAFINVCEGQKDKYITHKHMICANKCISTRIYAHKYYPGQKKKKKKKTATTIMHKHSE